jgi:hypothetical protein
MRSIYQSPVRSRFGIKRRNHNERAYIAIKLLRPTLTHLDGFLPPPEFLRTFFGRNFGLERCHSCSVDVLQLLEALPDSNREPCCNGCTESRGFEHGWTLDRNTNKICLGLHFVNNLTRLYWDGTTSLHAEVRIRHSAIYGQLSQSLPTILLHGIENRLRLETCRLESCSRNMTFLGVCCYTNYDSR